MGLVEPDDQTFSISADNTGDIDRIAGILGLTPDQKAGLEALYPSSETEARKEERERERLYQADEAATLLSGRYGVWSEVDCSPSFDVGEELNAMDLERIGRNLGDSNDVWFSGTCTAHQFYYDLYGGDLFFSFNYVSDETIEGVLVNHRDRKHPYQLYRYYLDFLKAVTVEQSFIYMGRFWRPTRRDGTQYLIAKRNAMTHIGGFCVDIDRRNVDGKHYAGSAVVDTVASNFARVPELVPNYVMLSGTGVQLWYTFRNLIPLLSAKKSPRARKYQDVLKSLYRWWDGHTGGGIVHVDTPCATICHAFRAPASPSKLGYPTRLFALNGRRRPACDPVSISEFLGCGLKQEDAEPWNQERHEAEKAAREAAHAAKMAAPATDKQVAYLERLRRSGFTGDVPDALTVGEAGKLIHEAVKRRERAAKSRGGQGHIDTSAGHSVAVRHRDSKLYEYTLRRIQAGDSHAGTRYNALFALAGLAWNCGVPKQRLKADCMAMLDLDWAKVPAENGEPLTEDDVRDAIKGYNQFGALRTRDAVEARLGWTYAPPAKRNGRTRKEHLWGDWKNEKGRSVVNTARENRLRACGRPKGSQNKEHPKRDEIIAYRQAHPDATQREIAAALGISKTTVNKWLNS